MTSAYSLIIPAAGSGKRMGHGHNKLFISLAGKPVLWHTLKAFENAEGLSEIILAIRPEDRQDIEDLLDSQTFGVPVRMVTGGETRQASVFNALQAVDRLSDSVWIHDGARPFITAEIREKLMASLKLNPSSIVAVPANDTVKKTDPGGHVMETLDRESLWLVQTPQAFRRTDLVDANRKALDMGFQGTDDSSLMEWAGYTVTVVMGDYFNIKITTPEDLVLAEAILAFMKRS